MIKVEQTADAPPLLAEQTVHAPKMKLVAEPGAIALMTGVTSRPVPADVRCSGVGEGSHPFRAASALASSSS
jgi:hypothetical protein